MKKTSRFLGIGLLELMLSLAIIAILLIMAIRYYQSANTSQQISAAADMFNAARSAVKNYANDLTSDTSASSNKGNTVIPTIQTLSDAGYLPPGFGNGTGVNPWGGNLMTVDNSATTCTQATQDIAASQLYGVCMDNVPANICPQLEKKLESTMNSTASELASCTTGDSGADTESIVATYAY